MSTTKTLHTLANGQYIQRQNGVAYTFISLYRRSTRPGVGDLPILGVPVATSFTSEGRAAAETLIKRAADWLAQQADTAAEVTI